MKGEFFAKSQSPVAPRISSKFMISSNDRIAKLVKVKRPGLFAVIVMIVFLVFTQILAFQSYLLRKSTEKEELVREINSVKDRFQVVLKHNLSAAQTLAFIIKTYGEPRDFEAIGKAIVDAHKGIDAIQLTRNGVITHVYPLKGNATVIGYDILASETTRKEANIAIQKNELFFAGPLTLKQGGIAIIGRLPIFVGDEFYGFAAVITKLETLTQALGMRDGKNTPYVYQLSKINPNSLKEEYFLPNSIQLNSDKTLSAVIPDGNWRLYIAKRARTTNFSFASVSVLGIMFSFVCALFAWYVVQQPKKLEALVKNKTEQIRAAELTTQTTLERVSDAVISLDSEWRYTYLNDAALLQHPGGREATLGRVIWEVHPELHNSSFSGKFEEALRTKKVLELEEYYEPLKAWFVVKIYPSENGLTLFYRNVTEQKINEREVLAQKLLSESIINSLPGIFYLYDRNQRFVKWNKNFEKVSGYTGDEISTMTPLDFFDDDERTLLQQRIETVFEKGMAEVEAHFLTKDRRKIPFYFNGYLCSINGEDYLIGVGIDITERRAAEREKERVTEDLVQRYKNMEQFSYIVSHNIRAPVANLIGLAELLKNGLARPSDHERVLEGLSTAARRLDEVIVDLNEILSIRTRVVAEKEPVLFEEVLKTVLLSTENFIQNDSMEIDADFSEVASFTTVKVYLHSIFYNLICNSIKYRRQDEALRVQIRSEKTTDGLRLIFRDNGLGIDLERYGQSLFGLYKRFHLHIEGKGLGLFMVKTQVESLGGKISVKSELNSYTEFIIEFPMATTHNYRNQAVLVLNSSDAYKTIG